MKLSFNKIRFAGEHYKTPNLVKDGLDALVDRIGAQLGAVEGVVDYGKRFDGVIVVKVVACDKHPNADKLSVCAIDDGGSTPDVKRDDKGLVQVVCGAPNVRAGMLAAWLPPGSIVPSTADKEPFVLEARELRGVVSNGMLASPSELGIGESHDGILEVDVDAKLGVSFSEAYRGEGEAVIDIENKMFTHRPDCFGILGLTREIAGIQQLPFVSPDWYVVNPQLPAAETEELPLQVENELPDQVPRFTAVALSDVTVKPSPIWLQIVLSELGIRPINSIVDYTNFWMLETGQPLHAYDYDKVKALSEDVATLIIRNPKSGEKLTLLGGKEIEPRAEAIMIATDKQAISIGGVMGGAETEVDDNTKNIILECANFDMYSTRRTVMTHGLFTDAATRFTKGQSPLQNLAVLVKTVESLRTDAGAKIAGRIIDNNNLDKKVLERQSLFLPIKISASFVNERLGSALSAAEMAKLLTNVEFKVDVSDDELTVQAPFWRTDVELREDLVEEIGRLHGYEQLPLELPKRDLTPAAQDPMLEMKSRIRRKLSASGANEILTYSFVHGDLFKKTGQAADDAYQIANALSPSLQYYRLSLTPSLLDKVHANIKAGYDKFALFELGKAHVVGREEDGLPIEFGRVALVFAANKKAADKGAPYYQARQYLMSLLDELGLAESVVFEAMTDEEHGTATVYYDQGRSATLTVDGKTIGRIGEYKASVRSALKLPTYTAGFELGLGPQLELKQSKQYAALSRFPSVKQDITLRVPAEVSYQKLRDVVQQSYIENASKQTQTTLTPLDIFQNPNDQQYNHVTFRLTTASFDRTLTDVEINQLIDKIASEAKAKLKAERI